MSLRNHIDLFLQKRTPDILSKILTEHGKYGFSIACKAAGITRGRGKRILGIYDDAGAIMQVASKTCGYKTTSFWRS